MMPSQSEGIVIQASSGLFQVETADGVIECMARAGADPGAIAAGDHVLISPQPAGRGVIESLMPRTTRFSRKVAGRRQDEQVIAANLDQVVIVLAAAEHCDLNAIVCINKVDLVPAPDPDSACDLADRAEIYSRIGYMVIMTSAETGSGIALLRQTLEGRVSALVGPSGVGKSSLICAVSPGVDLDTSEISSSTGKGRHTTTCSRLIKLDGGGYVADTPGMREFGFHQISRDELAWCFREFRPHTKSCRFADCHHVKEPGCGVREAVEQGLVSPGRYEHYVRLMGGVNQSNRLVVC